MALYKAQNSIYKEAMKISNICFICSMLIFLTSCDNGIEKQSKKEQQFKNMLISSQKQKESIYKQRKKQMLSQASQLSPDSVLIIPDTVKITEDGKGMETIFTLHSSNELNMRKAEGFLQVMSHDESFHSHHGLCNAKTIKIMHEFGYYTRERIFLKNGDMVKEVTVTADSCEKYLKCSKERNGRVVPIELCEMN